jgi:plasmid stabilization system protein ParE
MLTVVYHPEAEAEVIAAGRHYNERLPGLGADLLDEVNQAVAAILKTPTRWRIIDEDVRRYSTKRFPYTIFYRVEPARIRILAVAHHRRHPNYWKDRKEY